jgi:hypothetical protein
VSPDPGLSLGGFYANGYFLPSPNSFLIQTTIAPNGPAVSV